MYIKGFAADNKRVHWVDAAKGLCIFFVVVSHYGVEGHILGAFYQYFFLPLFFLLSGFVYKKKDTCSFFKGLTWGLLTPLVCFTIIYHLATYTFFYNIINGNIGEQIILIFRDILLGKSFWFLNCLIIVQIIWHCISKFIIKLSIRWHILVSLIIISFLFVAQLNRGGHLLWNVDTAIWSTGFYSLGVALKRVDSYFFYLERINRKFLPHLFFMLLLYIVVVYSISSLEGKCDIHYNDFGKVPVLYYILSVLGTGTVLFIFRVLKTGLLLQILGQHTLVIYVLQGHAYLIVDKLINTCRLSYYTDRFPNLFTIVIALIVCIICTAISLFLNRYIPFLVGKKKSRNTTN